MADDPTDDPTDESGGRRGRKGRRARRKAREEETPEEIQSRSQWRKKAAAERIEDLKKEQEELQKILKTEEDTYAVKELQKVLSETNDELLKTYREHMRDLARKGEIITQELKDQVRELEKVVKEEQKRAKAVEESAEAAANLGKSLGQAFRVTRGGIVDVQNLGDKFEQMGKAIGSGKEGLLNFGKEFGKSFGGAYLQMVVDMATMLVNLAMEVENVGRNMRRTTGMSEELARSIESAIPSVREFTHEFGELADAGAVLYRNYTDFSMILPEVASQLALEATMLNRLGVSYESYADGVQLATKALGVSADKSGDMMRDLTAYAMDIGMDVGQLTSGFASSREHVSKFGSDGVKAFKDLARTSKITGIDLQRLFAITSKFDTFEGAAEQAGMLNAALGGNFVNAMDLMMETDPATRFDMIRDAIKGTVGEFKDMEYYQRIFYARAAGLDNVAELALVMSGRYDLLGDKMKNNASDYVSMAEKAQAFQTVQDQIATLIQRNIKILPDVMKAIEKVMRWLASPAGQKTITEFFENSVKLVTALANNIDKVLAALPTVAKGVSILGPAMAILGPILAFGSGVAASVAGNKLTASNLPRWMGGKGKGPGGGGGGAGGAGPQRGDFASGRAGRREFRKAQRKFNKTAEGRAAAEAAKAKANQPGFFKRMQQTVSTGFSDGWKKTKDLADKGLKAAGRGGPSGGGTGGSMFRGGRRGFVNVDMLLAGQGDRLAAAGDKMKKALNTKVVEPLAKFGDDIALRSRNLVDLGKNSTKAIGPWLDSMKGTASAFIETSPRLAAFKGWLGTTGRAIGRWAGPVGLAIDYAFAFKGAFDSVTESVKRGEGILQQISAAFSGAFQGLASGFKWLLSKIPGFDETGSFWKLEGADVSKAGVTDEKRRAQQVKIQTQLLKRAQSEGTSVKGLLDAAKMKSWRKGAKTTDRQVINPAADRDRTIRNTVQAAMKEQSVGPTTRLAEQLNEWQEAMKPSTILEKTLPDQEITVNLTLDGQVIDQRTIKTVGKAGGLGGITGMGFGTQS